VSLIGQIKKAVAKSEQGTSVPHFPLPVWRPTLQISHLEVWQCLYPHIIIKLCHLQRVW